MKNLYYLIPYEVREKLNPRQQLRELKWARQRVSRGWSNRDTWGAGEHIAKITAEMLQHLNDHGTCSWPEWFKLNVQEEGKNAYTNLQDVIDDINRYLVHTETTWGDDLKMVYKDKKPFDHDWADEKTGKILSEADIKRRMNKWRREERLLYKKAQKAMTFFGRHFEQFWD